MSFELILPFFPDELRTLLLDPSISDLMINGTTNVFADRGGVVERIVLSAPYTNDRLQAAIERVARILGQDLTSQNPILNTRLPDGSRVAVVGSPSSINGPTFTVRKFNRWFTSDELIASGSLPEQITEGSLSTVILECHQPNGTVSPIFEFPVAYGLTGEGDRKFTADRAALARYLAKLKTVPTGTVHRIFCSFKGPRLAQQGWGAGNRASVEGMRSYSFGTLAAGPHASTGLRYFNK